MLFTLCLIEYKEQEVSFSTSMAGGGPLDCCDARSSYISQVSSGTGHFASPVG